MCACIGVVRWQSEGIEIKVFSILSFFAGCAFGVRT